MGGGRARQGRRRQQRGHRPLPPLGRARAPHGAARTPVGHTTPPPHPPMAASHTGCRCHRWRGGGGEVVELPRKPSPAIWPAGVEAPPGAHRRARAAAVQTGSGARHSPPGGVGEGRRWGCARLADPLVTLIGGEGLGPLTRRTSPAAQIQWRLRGERRGGGETGVGHPVRSAWVWVCPARVHVRAGSHGAAQGSRSASQPPTARARPRLVEGPPLSHGKLARSRRSWGRWCRGWTEGAGDREGPWECGGAAGGVAHHLASSLSGKGPTKGCPRRTAERPPLTAACHGRKPPPP